MGSLSYKPRGNLSVYIGIYYRPIATENKRILLIREVYSSLKCPFCPVIFGAKSRNSLPHKLIQNVRLSRADIL